MKVYGLTTSYLGYDDMPAKTNNKTARQRAKKEIEEGIWEYGWLAWDTGKCDWQPPNIDDDQYYEKANIEYETYLQILNDTYLMGDESDENNSQI